MPLTATGEWDVEVGRIRANDVFGDYGLDLFVCGDQVIRIQDSILKILNTSQLQHLCSYCVEPL